MVDDGVIKIFTDVGDGDPWGRSTDKDAVMSVRSGRLQKHLM